MSLELRRRILGELEKPVIVDPHTHINPLAPAAATLADILGYHYYTELAHSAGMPKNQIEEPDLDPRTKVQRLVANLEPIRNTIQYSWLIEMLRELFDAEVDDLTPENCDQVYDLTVAKMSRADWADEVLRRSRLQAVFLTNDFDDPLTGFDTSVYVPCLRTDDLVFHLRKPSVRERVAKATGRVISDAATAKAAVDALFRHFVDHSARACAISLPPDFTPERVTPSDADAALSRLVKNGDDTSADDCACVAKFMFWTLAEHCAEHKLPFDLMIGVNRAVYEEGVFQGQDLFDSRVSLIQYRSLFNAFPQVTFPVSVLASVTNQELVSYSWIFPNVITNGHWWYSNTPPYIEFDAAARLEAVPATKQIGYYSDMYKLEFALPKFAMYRRILAKVLADRFVIDRGWSETKAVEFGLQVLDGNSRRIFNFD